MEAIRANPGSKIYIYNRVVQHLVNMDDALVTMSTRAAFQKFVEEARMSGQAIIVNN